MDEEQNFMWRGMRFTRDAKGFYRTENQRWSVWKDGIYWNCEWRSPGIAEDSPAWSAKGSGHVVREAALNACFESLCNIQGIVDVELRDLLRRLNRVTGTQHIIFGDLLAIAMYRPEL